MRGPEPADRAARRTPQFARRFLPVWIVGLVGVGALLLQPLPAEVIARMPATPSGDTTMLRALALPGPALLVTIAALAGAACAHRTGIVSALAGTASHPGWRAIPGAAIPGFALGVALSAADILARPWLDDAPARALAPAASTPDALALGVLYGGLAEEVVMRWGLQATLAWAATCAVAKLAGERAARRSATLLAGVAIAMAAIGFAAAHLPALAAVAEPTPGLVVRTLVLNTVAGVLYGTLCLRRGLEAAMTAHAATHVGLHAVRIIRGAV